MIPVAQLEKPRIWPGGQGDMKRFADLMAFGDYFINLDDDRLYQWDGTQFIDKATSVPATAMGVAEEMPVPYTATAGGTNIAPGQQEGDPPVSGDGSHMPGLLTVAPSHVQGGAQAGFAVDNTTKTVQSAVVSLPTTSSFDFVLALAFNMDAAVAANITFKVLVNGVQAASLVVSANSVVSRLMYVDFEAATGDIKDGDTISFTAKLSASTGTLTLGWHGEAYDIQPAS